MVRLFGIVSRSGCRAGLSSLRRRIRLSFSLSEFVSLDRVFSAARALFQDGILVGDLGVLTLLVVGSWRRVERPISMSWSALGLIPLQLLFE